jgi:hypothetical protein
LHPTGNRTDAAPNGVSTDFYEISHPVSVSDQVSNTTSNLDTVEDVLLLNPKILPNASSAKHFQTNLLLMFITLVLATL